MSPFDQPPAGTPVSFEPPEPPPVGPRRGRMAAVAVVTALLVGGGIAGVSQLVAADRPDLATGASAEPDEAVPPVDETTDETGDEETDAPEPAEETDEGSDEAPEPTVETDGKIVLDDGDGDPIVIDLGDIGDEFGRLTECIGLPMFDFDVDLGGPGPGDAEPGDLPIGDLDELLGDLPFDLGDLDELFGDLPFDLDGEFGDLGTLAEGGSVTVAGPDGVSVIDLGDDGSVTITKEDGDVTISTDGDATVSDLDEVFGEFGSVFGDDVEFGDIFDDSQIEEFLESLPDLGEFTPPTLGDGTDLDPAEIQACLDEVLGR